MLTDIDIFKQLQIYQDSAITSAHPNVVEEAYAFVCQVNMTESNYNPLHWAVLAKWPALVDRVLKSEDVITQMLHWDAYEDPAIFYSIRDGEDNITKAIILANPKIARMIYDKQHNHFITPIILNQSFELFNWYMETPDSLTKTEIANLRNNEGQSLLLIAAFQGYIGVAEWLMTHIYPDIDIKTHQNINGHDALQIAAKQGETDFTYWLYKKQYYNPEDFWRNTYDITPATLAIQQGRKYFLCTLRDRGCISNQDLKMRCDDQLQSPALIAAACGQVNILEWLYTEKIIDADYLRMTYDDEGCNTIMLAAENEQTDTLIWMKNKGIIKGKVIAELIEILVENYQDKILRLLFDGNNLTYQDMLNTDIFNWVLEGAKIDCAAMQDLLALVIDVADIIRDYSFLLQKKIPKRLCSLKESEDLACQDFYRAVFKLIKEDGFTRHRCDSLINQLAWLTTLQSRFPDIITAEEVVLQKIRYTKHHFRKVTFISKSDIEAVEQSLISECKSALSSSAITNLQPLQIAAITAFHHAFFLTKLEGQVQFSSSFFRKDEIIVLELAFIASKIVSALAEGDEESKKIISHIISNCVNYCPARSIKKAVDYVENIQKLLPNLCNTKGFVRLKLRCYSIRSNPTLEDCENLLKFLSDAITACPYPILFCKAKYSYSEFIHTLATTFTHFLLNQVIADEVKISFLDQLKNFVSASLNQDYGFILLMVQINHTQQFRQFSADVEFALRNFFHVALLNHKAAIPVEELSPVIDKNRTESNSILDRDEPYDFTIQTHDMHILNVNHVIIHPGEWLETINRLFFRFISYQDYQRALFELYKSIGDYAAASTLATDIVNSQKDILDSSAVDLFIKKYAVLTIIELAIQGHIQIDEKKQFNDKGLSDLPLIEKNDDTPEQIASKTADIQAIYQARLVPVYFYLVLYNEEIKTAIEELTRLVSENQMNRRNALHNQYRLKNLVAIQDQTQRLKNTCDNYLAGNLYAKDHYTSQDVKETKWLRNNLEAFNTYYLNTEYGAILYPILSRQVKLSFTSRPSYAKNAFMHFTVGTKRSGEQIPADQIPEDQSHNKKRKFSL